MQEYEYKFIRIDISYSMWSNEGTQVEDYHQIIRHHAVDGWRLVQIFAPPTRTSGLAAYIEIILERPKSLPNRG